MRRLCALTRRRMRRHIFTWLFLAFHEYCSRPLRAPLSKGVGTAICTYQSPMHRCGSISLSTGSTFGILALACWWWWTSERKVEEAQRWKLCG